MSNEFTNWPSSNEGNLYSDFVTFNGNGNNDSNNNYGSEVDWGAISGGSTYFNTVSFIRQVNMQTPVTPDAKGGQTGK